MKTKLKSKKIKFPVSKPHITKNDIFSVTKALQNKWISSDGPEVKKFETKFSKIFNRKFSVAVSSGTAALEIAIKSLGIKKNDEVIIPNFTIISNALAVLRQNAKIVLVDCNLSNWNIDLQDLKKKINKKTKAIIITHIYSFSNDMDKIFRILNKKKIFIIEDAAEVIGLKYKNKMCGSFGDISTFSFYANKQITTGEGGMISTNNDKIFEKCKSLRNLCFGSVDRFNHNEIGWNYRMTNIQASLGLSQIKNLKKVVTKKMQIGQRYYKRLNLNPNIQILPPKISYSKNIYWVVGIVIQNNLMTAKQLSKKLINYGISSRPFFYPMHRQNILNKMKLVNSAQRFPNSDYLSKYGLYLPSYFSLNNKEIDFISKVVNKVLQ